MSGEHQIVHWSVYAKWYFVLVILMALAPLHANGAHVVALRFAERFSHRHRSFPETQDVDWLCRVENCLPNPYAISFDTNRLTSHFTSVDGD